MSRRRAVVIGGGIAGPVAALGLTEAGFETVLYERYAEAATTDAGTWLTLAVNGIQALKTLQLHEGVLSAAFPSTEIELFTSGGRALGVAPLGGVLADGTSTQTIKRADLYRVIAKQVRDRGVKLVYGAELESAEASAQGVVARFADRTEIEADLLVGADGVHSRVRSAIDPAARSPRVTEMGNVGGFVCAPHVAIRPGTYRMIFGKRAFFGYVVHPSGEVWWFANPPTPWPATADRAWLSELFDGDVGPAAELIRATPGELRFTKQYELPSVAHWTRGAMVLIGDAAHAASPTSGQGASLAIEDAVVLARCLREFPLPKALEHFVERRRARCERVVREAARMSAKKVPGPLGRWTRDLVLPFFLSRATAADRAWLYDYET